ncbi:MAG: hypothetical protein K2X32_02820 [Phycisphaerales bacterium]|nr:hypothetical protein [Phycisphaerales bacterium]
MSRPIAPRRIEVVDDRIAAILKAKSPTERLAMASAAHAYGVKATTLSIRTRHPDWGDARVHAEVVRSLLFAASTQHEWQAIKSRLGMA